MEVFITHVISLFIMVLFRFHILLAQCLWIILVQKFLYFLIFQLAGITFANNHLSFSGILVIVPFQSLILFISVFSHFFEMCLAESWVVLTTLFTSSVYSTLCFTELWYFFPILIFVYFFSNFLLLLILTSFVLIFLRP